MEKLTRGADLSAGRECDTTHGSFMQAHHFSIQSSNLYDITTQNNHFYGVQSDHSLNVLSREAMLDVAFDSAARDPPPRCHPGTRAAIIQSVQERFQSPELGARLIRLSGPAGVGKSAIMQNLTEAEDAGKTLGAAVFLSRANGRNVPKKVFATISYQMCLAQPTYREYITRHISDNPSFLNKTIAKQFEHLILIPLGQKNIATNSRRLLIFLDGLDELQGEREQAEIVDIIISFIVQYPSLPLIWVIASRPEPHIGQAFSRAKRQLGTMFHGFDIPIDSVESVRDVERFLHSEFTRIRESFPDVISPSQIWPLGHQFLMLSNISSGHFAFASTAIRYIDDPSYGNPVSRLNRVVSILHKRFSRHDSDKNPFHALDTLYAQIMADIPTDVLPITRSILCYIAILNRIERYRPDRESTVTTCNIMGLEQHVFYGALRKLHSVLGFPEPRKGLLHPVRFLHTSFSDYLESLAPSSPYKLKLSETATCMWRRYMEILRSIQWNQGNDGLKDSRLELSWPLKAERPLPLDLLLIPSELDQAFHLNESTESPSLVLEHVESDVLISVRRRWPNLLFESFTPSPDFNLRHIPVQDLANDIQQLDFSRSLTNRSFLWNTLSPVEWFEYGNNCPISIRDKMIRDYAFTSIDPEIIRKSLAQRGWFVCGTRRQSAALHDLPFLDSDGEIL
ncbi:hypothetical protein NP233_g10737 [Leucocoprinus birnbaumii]|uniref:NACHT domain-containing protein n=1 Tax=Leucocoprinus birnbaumii TaxID=56174 RepID=A0AAD5YRM1_9AGAR|nr:hypothetical protein NP233_g10737 [Leucocoprinus birnbaumii]